MKIFLRSLVFVACLVAGVSFMPRMASADLSITPIRISFEGRDRFASVILINTGDELKTYQMGWRYYRMQETGSAYVPVTESVTEFDLSKHIVFTPRRVTLAPGAKQKIRLALRRPENVPPGDYHAHLLFAPVKGDIVDGEPLDTQEARPGVVINVGYTIPVFFRVGEADVSFDIGDVKISRNENNGKLLISVPINRVGGPYGAQGHLYVYHQDESGQEILIAQMPNAHIFPEVDRRVFDMTSTQDNLGAGSLRIVLKHFDDKSEDRVVYAQKIIPLKL